MLCLGIETSCDETSLALVRRGVLLAEVTASQADAHALFGGVVPELASREHYRVAGPLLDDLLRRADVAGHPVALADVDAVAVARGPGLLGSLLVGLGLAKGLALGLGARLVGVNHLHAHLLAPGLEQELLFPAVGLLVSGGHTHLYRMDSPTAFTLLGRTLDDAAGEAFDKVAKMLNLPYPGGVHIDRLSRGVAPDTSMFPRPYLDNRNMDFSFSGLKTAVSTHLQERPRLRLSAMQDPTGLPEGPLREELGLLCASFSHSVADTLRVKTARAVKAVPGARALVVAGGVAANSMVRAMAAALAAERDLRLLLPSTGLCTDNAAMVAYTGELLARQGLCHGWDLEAIPRGRAVPDDYLRCV